MFSVPGLHAGNHALGASYAAQGTFGTSSATGTLTVSPATLTASIIGTPTKTYDGTTSATLIASNYSLTGLVGTDSFTVTKATGSYNSKDVATATTVSTTLAATDFTAGASTLASDYTLPTTASGPGKIIPAPLTVAANNQTKITEQANPPFTVSYSDFVLGEGPSVLGGTLTYSTTVTNSSPPGTYAITPAGLTSGNYAIKFVSGTLTVISYSQATTNLQAQVDAPACAEHPDLPGQQAPGRPRFLQPGQHDRGNEPVGGVYQ